MSWREFRTVACGKWVLAGEHAVLRGGQAIALPHPHFTLTLHYLPGNDPLRVLPESASLVVQELVRSALENLKPPEPIEWPGGLLNIESTIPTGAGLGSSAALSVAVARWLSATLSEVFPGGGSADGIIGFARKLEDCFHGRSSGMDVSVVTLERPILFSMQEGAKPLEISRLPGFSFHDTGMRASTRECIRKVEALRIADESTALRLDESMQRAVLLALEGLQVHESDEVRGLALLQESMTESMQAFQGWGLVPKEVLPRIQTIAASSLATRITGAGGGGFIVALTKEAQSLSRPHFQA